jgi:hypothetical protein
MRKPDGGMVWRAGDEAASIGWRVWFAWARKRRDRRTGLVFGQPVKRDLIII